MKEVALDVEVLWVLPFRTASRSMHDAAAYRVKFSSLFMGQLASECGQTPFPIAYHFPEPNPLVSAFLQGS
jgi:hypothetical protein